MTDEDLFQRVRDIARDPWAKRMMMGRSKSGAAKELKSFSALRKKVGLVVMAAAAQAGLPDELALVTRLTQGENK